MKKTLLCCALLITALALAGCGIFGGDYTYRKLPDGTAEITKYRGKAETLEVPGELGGKTVTGIGSYAFSDCARLRSVTLPDSVTGIGDNAFFFLPGTDFGNVPGGFKANRRKRVFQLPEPDLRNAPLRRDRHRRRRVLPLHRADKGHAP